MRRADPVFAGTPRKIAFVSGDHFVLETSILALEGRFRASGAVVRERNEALETVALHKHFDKVARKLAS